MSRTVKVRIAVAVDPEGAWCGQGWSDHNGGPVEGAAVEAAVGAAASGSARFWIEAELPVPERDPVTIRGTVSDA
jgi:hypothetical protein